MAFVKSNTTITEYQNFVKEVYGLPNDRDYTTWDILTNLERFIMRGLKGIRKKDENKIKINLLISLSWFMSIMNQLHIDIENEVWKRFPYLCSYCGMCPCSCKERGLTERQKVLIDEKKRPKTLEDFQTMFNKIYPSETRTLEHSGVHLAEELGEFAEAILIYRGEHKPADFYRIPKEAADLFSCLMGVFNSLGVNVAKELSTMFSNNCHVCHKAPCVCSFSSVIKFES
jgi:NTP pyrophosphatase (non-canonical NTP hydrolase)